MAAACPTRLTPSDAPRRWAASSPVWIDRSTDAGSWDAYVAAHPGGTIQHLFGWMKAVSETFGHEAFALRAVRDGVVRGVLPLALVRSLLAGPMLVSVPYGIYGGPLADDDRIARLLIDEALRLCDRVGARRLDLRTTRAVDCDLPTCDDYVTFQRDLPSRADDVTAWLPRKARAAARQAEARARLTVEYSLDRLNEFWTLYSRSMRRLGSINYPLRFFERLIAAFEPRWPGSCNVQIVQCDGRAAAGLLTFHFGPIAMPYVSGWDERVDVYGLNQFLYANSMQHAVRAGCRIYDFGRSRRANIGAAAFKRFFGFEPTPLAYHRWSRHDGAGAWLSPGDARWSVPRRIWRRLPLALTRPLGAWLAKSIPG